LLPPLGFAYSIGILNIFLNAISLIQNNAKDMPNSGLNVMGDNSLINFNIY
jgi:hypothetical protein